MKVGVTELVLLSLIILIVFGPFLLRVVKKLNLRFSKKLSGKFARCLRRWAIRLEKFGQAFGRACRIGALALLVFVILFELSIYFMMRR